MAKTVATILGVVFLIVGLAGFVARGTFDMLGVHLSTAHNLVHIISGIIALYFGLAGTLAAARLFDIIFGIVYGLLGIAGFLLGHVVSRSSIPDMMPSHHMLTLYPGVLEFGSRDHALHILLGIIFLLGGLLTKTAINRAADRT